MRRLPGLLLVVTFCLSPLSPSAQTQKGGGQG